MKKFLKVFFVILLLLFGAIISIPFIFKGKIIAKAVEEANKNLNAKVAFGSFDLSIISTFPNLGLQIEDFSIEGKNEFQGDTLIRAGKFIVNLNLMSVIKGDQYLINKISIQNATINALVDKNGKANWDITKPSEELPEKKEEPSVFKMSLKKFEIKNSNILYHDKQTGIYTMLSNLNHELKGDFTQDIFEINTLSEIDAFTFKYGGVAYLKNVRTKIIADLNANMPQFKFTFKNNEFHLNDLQLGLDGFFAMPKEDMDMDLKFNCKQTTFATLLSLVPGAYTKDFKDIKTSGNFSLAAFVKGIYNEKRMPAFGVDLKVANAMFQYPTLPKAVTNIALDLKVKNPDGSPDKTITDINKFHAELGPNPIDVVMHIATPVSDPFIDGMVKAKLDLNSIKDFLPLESEQKLSGIIMSDVTLKGHKSTLDKEQYDKFNANGSVSIINMNYKSKDFPAGMVISEANLLFSPKFAELTKFSSKIGKSDLNANGKIENFIAYALSDEKLTGKFNVNSNYLDINEFMGEESSAASSDTATTTEVIEVPSNIDFELDGSFMKLLYSNIDMSNVKGKIIVRNSKVNMNNLAMNMLDGNMVLNGSYSTENIKKPFVDFDMKIADFDVQKTAKTFNTVQKIAPIIKQANGKFGILLAFSSVLKKDMSPDLNTLSGKGNLRTNNVIVSNFPMFSNIAEAIKMPEYKQLNLNNTNISFFFKDGKINVDPFDFKIKNSLFTMNGIQGFDQSINYNIKADIKTSDLGSGANALASNIASFANSKGANFSVGENLKLNMKVTGTVQNPKLDAGFKDAANGLKDQLKDELTNKKKELEDKAKAEVDKKKAQAEEKARQEADKKKAELEAKAKAEQDKLKNEAEKKKREAEDKARQEAEKKKKEAEEKAKKEAEKKLKGLFGK